MGKKKLNWEYFSMALGALLYAIFASLWRFFDINKPILLNFCFLVSSADLLRLLKITFINLE